MAKRKSKSKTGTGDLIEILIYVLFGSVIIPIVAGTMLTIEGDTTNFSTTEILVAGIVTTVLLLGFVYSIVNRFF